MNTASCRSAITYLDGDNGVLEYRGYPIEQLAEQSTYLEVAYLLIHGELPTQAQLDEWIARGDDPHVRAREHQELHAGLPLRRAPDGDARSPRSARSRRSIPTPRRSRTRSIRYEQIVRLVAKMPTLAAFSYRHNMGPAVRLSGQRPALPRQLPLDDVQDDRAQVRAGSPARARARHPLHPPRRPRAELLDLGGPRGRLLAGRPVLGRRRRRRRALRPAARRRQRGRAADAAPDRDEGEHPRLHQGREGGRRAADGLRPPGLQELRPARQDHQDGVPTTSSR